MEEHVILGEIISHTNPVCLIQTTEKSAAIEK